MLFKLEMQTPILLLFSGGIDSTAILHMYNKNGKNPQLIHFSYGQKSEQGELLAAERIAKHYNKNIINIKLKYSLTTEKKFCAETLFLL